MIDANEVIKITEKFKEGKAAEHDKIMVEMVKNHQKEVYKRGASVRSYK